MQSPGEITNLHVITLAGAESLCSATRTTDSGTQPVLVRFYGDQSRHDGEPVRNEFEITRKLCVPGVLKPIAMFDAEKPPFLLFEFLDLVPLCPTPGDQPWDMGAILRLARQLLVLAGRLHTLGILHLAINPFNLLIGSVPDKGSGPMVLLSGFGHSVLSSDFQGKLDYRRLPPEFIPYLSPEQTGRTGFSPDERSDYYSIGAVLYELVSGTTPVPTGEVEETVYAILTKPPVELLELRSDISPTLSAIVMRLLAKDPEDRYQSAGQILRDLRACEGRKAADSLSAPCHGTSTNWIGTIGRSVGVRFVGRERERTQLGDAVARTRRGEPTVVTVSGFSGSGKTTIVRDTLLSGAAPLDVVLSGKFELNSSAPYRAFVQACGAHTRKMLAQSESEAQRWHEAMSTFLRGHGLGLTGVFPEFDALAGTAADQGDRGEEFPPLERKRRLQKSIVDLFRTWTKTSPTVVLFLDDIQWADPASLELCLCLIEAAIPRLLVVVAYRASEVPAEHPVRPLVNKIEESAGERGRVILGPLMEGEIKELLTGLVPGLPRAQLAALSRYAEVRTGGNTHFVCQQVLRLCQRRELYFDFLRGHWVYSPSEEESTEGSPDITRFLADVMRELPKEERDVLSSASYFSHGATLHSLSLLTGIAPERTAAAMHSLCRRHFMTPSNPDGHLETIGLYRFAHDNVMQAAHLLVPPEDRTHLHVRIGRLLRSMRGNSPSNEQLYETVEHLNAGAVLLSDPSERYETAKLDLEAGVKAKHSSAFSSSAGYLRAGVNLLPDDCWEEEYALTLSLHEEAAETAFLVGEFARMNGLIDTITQKARCFFDSVRANEVRIQWLSATNRLQDAARLCIAVAHRLGIRHLATKNKAIALLRRLQSRVLARRIDLDRLAARPMRNPVDLAACRVMLRGFTPTITSGPFAVISLATELALLTLIRGISPYAATSLAALGMVLVAEQRITEGYRLGELALQLQERINFPITRATTQTIVYFFITPWMVHLSNMLPLLSDAMETGERMGEYEHAALAGHFLAIFTVLSGLELGEADREVTRITTIIDRLRQERSSIGVRRHHQFALNLITSPEGCPPYVFAGPAFDEATLMPVLEAAGDSSAIDMIMVYKTILAYLFDEEERALEFAEKAAALTSAVPAQPTVHLTAFYHSLVLLSVCGKLSWARRSALKKVREYLQLLKRWASSSPVNFQHRYDLVHAEYLAVLGSPRAEERFLEAVQNAASSGYIQDEALAHRRIAHFFEAVGKEADSRKHLQEAHRLYQKWGAAAVAAHLERRFPWLDDRPAPSPARKAGEPAAALVDLDLETLMNAGRVISSQIEIDSLIEQIIRIIMQCAGATHGILEVEENGSLIASLEGRAGQQGISVVRHDCAETVKLDGPVVRHVRETRESTVDAEAPEAVSASRLSVLCAPLLHRGKVKGLIYLENALAANVFTKERLRVVELLAAQAAVSLENAEVYHLHETVAEQREKLQAAEKLASLGALTASVAHEVSNPAHVIRLNAASISAALRSLDAAIEDGAAVGDTESAQARIGGAVREVTSAVDRIESIVGDLKEYMGGVHEEGGHEAELNAVVESVLRLSRPLVRRCTRCAETSLEPDLPLVRGEFGRLQQLVLNLVENACQAISDPDQAVKIQTCTLPGTPWVELSVVDEGRGINPGFLSRVTEPLFTTRRAEGGTGLGLAIVSGIVKEYGGELTIESTEGKGTRVRVRLVRAHQPA
jgi:predicted ATPase/signal transduction histidine kinase